MSVMQNVKYVDVFIFMGQSNMAGRGVQHLAPKVREGYGFEYRAVTDPDDLHPLVEPFGYDENDPDGVCEPGMKTGSMVSSFVNACTAVTKTPIVAVSCAKGASSIDEWLPGTAYYKDACRRLRLCEEYLAGSVYTVRCKSMVWCQGCTDGDFHMPKTEYKAKTREFIDSFVCENGLAKCFMIQIGNDRTDPALYVPIREAQTELAEEEDCILMVSESFRTFMERGLMKDQYHYLQQGYNIVGEEAGRNAGSYINGVGIGK